METFHLYHLAACWNHRSTTSINFGSENPEFSPPKEISQHRGNVIKAAAAHMVFAARTSQDFITPQEVEELERWVGQVGIIEITLDCAHHVCQAVLNALVKTEIAKDVSLCTLQQDTALITTAEVT